MPIPRPFLALLVAAAAATPTWAGPAPSAPAPAAPALSASALSGPALSGPAAACRTAIQAAERENRLPAQLLGHIARAESGRPDPQTGAVEPWPWTINAEGQGRWFESREEAVAAVRTLQARGVRVIDVGCLQVNLHHHPTAFESVEQAFEPEANARYAARLLKLLRSRSGDWVTAAGHYHSTTPDRAEAYRQRVLATWPEMQRRQAELRRREALVAAWAATRGEAGRPSGPAEAAAERAGRSVVVEVAEAPPLRR